MRHGSLSLKNHFGLSKQTRPPLYEVGISYHGRTYAEGKKIAWKDGFTDLYCIIKYNLFR